VPFQKAHETLKVFMISLTGVFLFIFVALNLMLMTIVIRPITKLSELADQVSLGKMDAPEFPDKGKDEIAILGASFKRMRTSLAQALKLLDE
jgi:protein-histidine pros-kinase